MPIVVEAQGQEFEFPDGMSQDAMRMAIRRHFAPPEPVEELSPVTPPSPEGMNDKGRVGPFIRGTVEAVGRGATANFGDEIAAGAGAVGNKAMRAVGIDVPEMGYRDIKSGMDREYGAFKDANPGFATAGEIGGTVLPGVGIGTAAVRALGAPGGFWSNVGGGALAGGPWGALDRVGRKEGPMGLGDVASEARAGAIEGGVTGAVGGGLGNTLGRVVGPWATDAAQRLTDRGIRLTPGQTLGGGFDRAEQVAQDIPFIGQMNRNRRTEGLEDFNRVALNEAMDPLDQAVPGVTRYGRADEPGRDMVGQAHDEVSQAYDALVPAMTGDLGDPQLMIGIQNAAYALPQAERDQFLGQIMHYYDRAVHTMQPNGQVSGEAMQDFITAVRDESLRWRTSTQPGTFSNEMADAFERVQNALETNLNTYTPPEIANAYRATNRAFANMVTVERAAGALGAEEGVYTPAQLLNAVKGTDRSKRRTAFALGRRGPMQDLAEDAKSTMSQRVGNSGSAERIFMQNLPYAVGAGAAMVNPWLAITLPGMALSNTAAAHRAFQRAATFSPMTRGILRRVMERSGAQTAVPAASQGNQE
jgi:hypothetical protein